MTEGILRYHKPYRVPSVSKKLSSGARQATRSFSHARMVAHRYARRQAFWRAAAHPVARFWFFLVAVTQPVRYFTWDIFCAVADAWSRTYGSLEALLLDFLERFLLRGRALFQPNTEAEMRSAPINHMRVNTIILFIFLSLSVFAFSFFSVGLEVILGGRSMGYVSSQTEFEEALQNVSSRVSHIMGIPYSLHPDVHYRYSIVDRRNLFDRTQVEDVLFGQISDIRNLYVLTVDNEAIAAAAAKADLQAVLDSVLAQYGTPDGRNAFVRDVKISRQWTSADKEMPIDDISKLLHSTVRDPQRYSVQAGDTLGTIAKKNGMTQEALLRINAGLNGDSVLKTNDSLLISKAIPFLSVKTIKNVTYSEEIPFETVYEESTAYFERETILKTRGKPGELVLNADISYVDGMEIERNILSSSRAAEPVTEVYYKGVTKRPPKYPTGYFIRPYTGPVSSGYGTRKLFGQWKTHEGIDFRGPIGGRIVASDGGTVVFAGIKNGYGKTVIIDHYNGVKTLYGHCSSLDVSVGQKVGQGEPIAKVGNTGRSTGPHVHFEIQINGQHVNPWNYLK